MAEVDVIDRYPAGVEADGFAYSLFGYRQRTRTKGRASRNTISQHAATKVVAFGEAKAPYRK